MTGVTLRFEIESDGDTRVYAAVEFDGFRGRTDWWGAASEFEEFTHELAAYPIEPAAPPKGRWLGCLSIDIVAIDKLGVLEVRACTVDNWEDRNRCDLVFRCRQHEVDQFRRDLLACIQSGVGTASLSPS